jgi:small subunit ribosomal protein S5
MKKRNIKASELELHETVVSINRVAKVTKGGRTFTFSAVVVVGDSKGVVGFGLGKAREVTEAITKGANDAKKDLQQVPITKSGTIPHDIVAKYSGAKVFLKPAAPGTGVIAGGAMRSVLEAAGVKDVLAKSKGSSNSHNLIKATLTALSQMRDAQQVANLRGISLDAVYNG